MENDSRKGILEDLATVTEDCFNIHVRHLQQIGMVVNANKTELLYSTREKNHPDLSICNSSITSTNKIKALGVLISSDLSWTHQVDFAINRSRHLINRFKILRKWLTQKDLLKLATSQFFSIIFYACQVWIGSLTSKDWKRLNSIHYCCLRTVLGDFRNKLSRQDIDKKTQRATPLEWAQYAVASIVIKLYNKADTPIVNLLRTSSYVNDRQPGKAKFTDRSRLKIGRQSIVNRIGPIFAKIDFDWIGVISDNTIRANLKRNFFKYID